MSCHTVPSFVVPNFISKCGYMNPGKYENVADIVLFFISLSALEALQDPRAEKYRKLMEERAHYRLLMQQAKEAGDNEKAELYLNKSAEIKKSVAVGLLDIICLEDHDDKILKLCQQVREDYIKELSKYGTVIGCYFDGVFFSPLPEHSEYIKSTNYLSHTLPKYFSVLPDSESRKAIVLDYENWTAFGYDENGKWYRRWNGQYIGDIER